MLTSKLNSCSLDEKEFKEELVEWLEFSDKQLSKHPVSLCSLKDYARRSLVPAIPFSSSYQPLPIAISLPSH